MKMDIAKLKAYTENLYPNPNPNTLSLVQERTII